MTLTVERLREVLHYDADTGTFTWKVRTSKRIAVGTVAGCINKTDGRRYVKIDKTQFSAHRLAWLYVNGEWPLDEIDHINGTPTDNRIANLRDVSSTMNKQNIRRARSSSTSGVLGAMKRPGGWKADIRVDGRRLNLGLYDTAEEAGAAYLTAKRLLHPCNTL